MFNLLPKDEKFYDELEQLSSKVVSAARQLEEIVRTFPNFTAQIQIIEQDRLGARKIFRESLQRLDQAFITPLDREDILNLITEMFGVVDRVSELSQRFRLYQLKNLYPAHGTGQEPLHNRHGVGRAYLWLTEAEEAEGYGLLPRSHFFSDGTGEKRS